MANYLICYDIANPKRLARVHRCIVKHAMFVQLSVYYLEGDQRDLERVLWELESIIDDAADDVRAYHVKPLSQALHIGCSWLPEGIGLHTNGSQLYDTAKSP